MRRRGLLGSVLVVPVAPGAPILRLAAPPPANAPVGADAELIRLYTRVRALVGDDLVGDAGCWDEALLQLCALKLAGILALQTKVQLALTLLPSTAAGSCPPWLSPEECLLHSVLRDVLGWTEHHER